MTDGDSGDVIGRGSALTCPSLALTKYWGKSDPLKNLPATPSLAVGLGGLVTETLVEVYPADKNRNDEVRVNGEVQETERYRPFFDELRRRAAAESKSPEFRLVAESRTDFPVAAGIASSAAGFAALALAAVEALSLDPGRRSTSALARVGSASAARSVYGGFTLLPAGGEYARQLHGGDWWPELRIMVVQTESGRKNTSSREAMERCRLSSPFYDAWVRDARDITDRALEALETRDLSLLGPVVRSSYLRMFATMYSADPPIRYWTHRSLRILEAVEELRKQGVNVWETMDAGPQVKLLCLEDDTDIIREYITGLGSGSVIRVCPAAPEPRARFQG